jgi:hypothetical protein
MDYTLSQLTTIVNSLLTRTNCLDGQNLVSPATGAVPNLVAGLASIQTDLGQLVASFESQLATMKTSLTTIQAAINTLTGTP